MNIPNELKGQPWSQLLWADVQQYAHNIDAHLSLPETPLVVDVGGNIGAAALLFHLRYQARVLSIEAIAETFTQLQQNCSSYAHITTVHQAVGASTGTTRLYRYPLAAGLGGLDSSRAHIWAALSKQALQQINQFHAMPYGWLGACFISSRPRANMFFVDFRSPSQRAQVPCTS